MYPGKPRRDPSNCRLYEHKFLFCYGLKYYNSVSITVFHCIFVSVSVDETRILESFNQSINLFIALQKKWYNNSFQYQQHFHYYSIVLPSTFLFQYNYSHFHYISSLASFAGINLLPLFLFLFIYVSNTWTSRTEFVCSRGHLGRGGLEMRFEI